MKAVWDRKLPRQPPGEQRRFLEVAQDCGFDTLVVSLDAVESTATERPHGLDSRAHNQGIRALDIVAPYVSSEDAEAVPNAALQRIQPAEEAFLDALTDHSGVYEHR